MKWRDSPSRSFLAGLLLLIALPAMALVWLGVRLLDQERLLEAQRTGELRQLAADRIAASLEQAIVRTESLRDQDGDPPKGLYRIELRADSVAVRPRAGIPFVPVARRLPEADPAVFLAAEEHEFRRKDNARAIQEYRNLAQSSEEPVRAGALLRLTRVLRREGKVQEALQALDQLARFKHCALGGVPADLVARDTRLPLLPPDASARERASLLTDLREGRWSLDQAGYERYAGEAPQEGLLLAKAVEHLHAARQRLAPQGRMRFEHIGGHVTILWGTRNETLRAILVPAAYEAAHWYRPSAQQVAPQPGPHSQRQLLWSGLVVLMVLLAGGAYLVSRTFLREIGLARQQSDFVAAVSHEFRTPLTSLRQFNDLLLTETEPPPEKRRKFHEAQARATERLHRLVESLLDFARMEAGRRPYVMHPLDLAALVDGTVAELRSENSARGFEIGWSKPTDPVMTQADGEALTRALWNLADNAIKYSNGTSRIAVHLESTSGGALVSVRDWGVGIPTSEQKRIFEKFYRGERARQESVKGTGIGLAMVRHIVEAHGGRVTVESQPGEGSKFTIELPRLEVTE